MIGNYKRNLKISILMRIRLKEWYQWFRCLALNIKRETLALSKFSKFSNSK